MPPTVARYHLSRIPVSPGCPVKLPYMKHLHLIISDLFPPQDIAGEACAGLRLPALERLLARGNPSIFLAATLEDQLCAAYGVQAVAPVRAAADGLDVGEGYWLCADPVSLQLQRAQMMLLPDVMPGKEEADALCAALEAHFAEDRLRFFAPHPHRWYMRLDTAPQLTTAPLSRVAWSDAKYHQPHGADALYWQTIINEAQMLLHDHPVNRAREARGELVINSLWLWGGGRESAMKSSFEVSGGDSGLARLLAETADVRQMDSLQAMLDAEYESGLWVCEALSCAIQRGDSYAWREAVQQFEQECAKPVLKALQAGRLHHLAIEVLQPEGVRRFELTRSSAWKLWRPVRPLA